MKRIAFSLLALTVCIGFSGCKSKPPKMDSDKTMFDYMQEQVGEINEKGGMAAVGLGESRNTQLAITKAKVEARKALAQQVSVKIENLEKAVSEEIGDLLFAVVNLARHLEVDAEQALSDANRKFESRFRHMEAAILAAGERFYELDIAALELRWQSAKKAQLDNR